MSTSEQLSLLAWAGHEPAELQLLTSDQIYKSEDYKLFQNLPENERFDRKSSRIQANDLAEDLSAFGNDPLADGGVIAIGISNDKIIEGCASLTDDRISVFRFAMSLARPTVLALVSVCGDL